MRGMESPPPYMPTKKKSNTGLIIGLVLGGIAICCIGGVALVGFFGLNFVKNTIGPMAECVMNYEYVDRALKKYTAEHDGKLPSAATWQDELTPYVEKETEHDRGKTGPFKVLDPRGTWGCGTAAEQTGMAFNESVNGKTLTDAMKNDTVVIFETKNSGRNLVEKYVDRDKSSSPKLMGKPRGWMTIQASTGFNIDGHVSGGNMRFDRND
jgi:hypothetical protein